MTSRLAALVVAATFMLGSVPAAASGASPGGAGDQPADRVSQTQASHRVHVVDYDLGSTAFTVPGLLSADGVPGPMELTGRVYYPSDLSRGRHPLIVMVHGYWPTCADQRSQAVVDDPSSSDRAVDHAYHELNRWPCAKGTPPLRSYLGYGYLARTLAARGDVVVSISANGANAIDSYRFQGDRARIALLSKNLRLWENFVEHHRGPLTSVLPDQLVGHVDLQDVGLLGHSRAGRAVLQYASDAYRGHWPDGVRIEAVLGLAPAQGDPGVDYTTTSLPVALAYGSCDGAVGPDDTEYYTPTAEHSARAIYEWRIGGANHDYWNTHWSPSSGQVGAADDATPDPQRPRYCADTITGSGSDPAYVRQLGERSQRHYGTVYVGAFFADSLHGSPRYRALLDGSEPLPGVTTQAHD